MASNQGKAFEQKFKEDIKKTIPGVTIDRIYDTMGNYKTSNVCDFIAYKYPNIFYVECKSCIGNTFNLNKLTQYDKLKDKVGIKGVRAGVVLWFREHMQVWYVPINTITQLKKDGKKSVHVFDTVDQGYRVIKIPSVEKRVFLDSDYSCLMDLVEGD